MKRPKPVYTPSATYRLQFNRCFTFQDATNLVGYLNDLGISDVYASPFLMARPGSMHGYDVTDPTHINPEIGDENSFLQLSGELRRHAMSMIVDVVPNHMCISDPSNVWWWDVLENGPSSPFSRFFDIDWHPPKAELANKVLLPVLGDQFGRVLENQEIQVAYREGQLELSLYNTPLPLAPRTWTMVLEPAAAKLRDRLGPESQHLAELESIITALSHLPGPTETDEAKIRERHREKEIVKRRLSTLVEASQDAWTAIQASLHEINGQRGDSRSFDRLERLLEAESYRLSFWRVAADEINYRRFFDINDLAAIRVEDPEVFTMVHALIFDHIRRGNISGLRVDHPDGLFDPEKYFRSVQDSWNAQSGPVQFTAQSGESVAPPLLYVVAEKILSGNEPLRTSWAIEGTTGYDFLNLLNGLFVDRSKKKAFEQLYSRFTGRPGAFEDLVYESKRLILQVALSSELNVLARRLDRLSEQHRWYRDFTLENLRDALREILVAFPVYRTYVQIGQEEVDPEDRKQIAAAVWEAKRRNPAISESVFDFIQSLLLLDHPDGLDDARKFERETCAMRFQQLCAPVMAKGVEDTAFYRYYPLASLNEVGGDPRRFGVSVSAFHRRNFARQELWPNTMSATSTHDSKRSEDVRARMNVLSEMPLEWYRAVRRWREILRPAKTRLGDANAPDANEEYLFYQTMVGTWPLLPMSPAEHASFTERIEHYTEKALNEAKMHTSWINPNARYNKAVQDFVAKALCPSPGNAFLEDFRQFQAPIARAGIWNSISQVVLKIASPGVPDFYQGTELWSFTLVDPDNREPVDYESRRKLLSTLRLNAGTLGRAALVERLVSNPCDGAIKLYITSRALCFRRTHRQLFASGSYAPLMVDGQRAGHAIAFERSLGDQTVIAIAGRFFSKLCNSHGCPKGEAWGDTAVVLPKRIGNPTLRDVFTGVTIATRQQDGKTVIPLSHAFQAGPFALLFSGGESRSTQ